MKLYAPALIVLSLFTFNNLAIAQDNEQPEEFCSEWKELEFHQLKQCYILGALPVDWPEAVQEALGSKRIELATLVAAVHQEATQAILDDDAFYSNRLELRKIKLLAEDIHLFEMELFNLQQSDISDLKQTASSIGWLLAVNISLVAILLTLVIGIGGYILINKRHIP